MKKGVRKLYGGKPVLDYMLSTVRKLIALVILDTKYYLLGHYIMTLSFEKYRGWDVHTILRLAIADLKRVYPKYSRLLDYAESETHTLLDTYYQEIV